MIDKEVRSDGLQRHSNLNPKGNVESAKTFMKYNPAHLLVHRTNSGKRCSSNFKMIVKEERMLMHVTVRQVANRLMKHAEVSRKGTYQG